MSRRDRIEVFLDILDVLNTSPERNTRLMQRANLSFNCLKKYLKMLLEKDLIQREEPYWKITVRGQTLLASLKNNLELLQ